MIRRTALLVVILLAAGAVLADGHHAVLTTEGVVYTVDPAPSTSIRITRRIGEQRTTFTVPETQDASIESQVKLLWDDATSSLFVMWHRSGDRVDQILLAQLKSNGTWSDVLPIASGGGSSRVGLEAIVTHAPITNGLATFIHAAWWRMNAMPEAEYALVAFENDRYVSAYITDLKSLAGVQADAIDIEPMDEALHPPLALEPSGANGVDIVFGGVETTRLTRVIAEPKVRPDARLWKPGRKGSSVTPRAGIQATSGQPLRAMIHNTKVVLYAPEKNFRFTIYDNVKWSPERMIQLDAELTSDQLVQELRRTIEQLDEEDGSDDGVID
jgi:hypothetical protein